MILPHVRIIMVRFATVASSEKASSALAMQRFWQVDVSLLRLSPQDDINVGSRQLLCPNIAYLVEVEIEWNPSWAKCRGQGKQYLLARWREIQSQTWEPTCHWGMRDLAKWCLEQTCVDFLYYPRLPTRWRCIYPEKQWAPKLAYHLLPRSSQCCFKVIPNMLETQPKLYTISLWSQMDPRHWTPLVERSRTLVPWIPKPSWTPVPSETQLHSELSV